jgi:hypothetical protein
MGLSWSSQADNTSNITYAWKTDTQDTRDHYHGFSADHSRKTLPDVIDMRTASIVHDTDLDGNSISQAVIIAYRMGKGLCETPPLSSLHTIRENLKHYIDKTHIYRRVPHTLTALKTCLSEGSPIVFGFTASTSFESQQLAETGIMSMPQKGEESLGGHAVICLGYSDRRRCFLVRNNRGDKWGEGGYFWMPYRFMRDQKRCSDFWTVTEISDQESV